MAQQMDVRALQRLVQSESIEDVSGDQLERYFAEGLAPEFLSHHEHAVDPRDGTAVIFNPARSRRPHDYADRPQDSDLGEAEIECPICTGQTTSVIDCAKLSEGFTFINKNLFPIFYPSAEGAPPSESQESSLADGQQPESYGYHFLQWTSTVHDHDWTNMPLPDRIVVLDRLAAMEKKLLAVTGGYVSIIKNYGRAVGGSLTHPHQQIVVSHIMPNRHRQNQAYLDRHGETFSAHMLRENPSELLIRDYGSAILLTPYFMRRPFDMLLILKDTRKSHLHALDRDELRAVADGWRDATRVMVTALQRRGRDPAYNIVVHNGPGAGLYLEFLPYSQEMGGFEHLGLYICQGNPYETAREARMVTESQE